MNSDRTTAAVQQYLNELAGVHADSPAEPIVRELLGRAAGRLRWLGANLLYRSYARLTHPPLNLKSDEMLSAVVERLLKALRAVRPGTVRQFFALASQHMRWELNDLARRLDQQPRLASLPESGIAAGREPTGGWDITPNALRMLTTIDGLPEEEREVFNLVRVQGLTYGEAADLLGVSAKTVQRRLNRGLLSLDEALDDLRPETTDRVPRTDTGEP